MPRTKGTLNVNAPKVKRTTSVRLELVEIELEASEEHEHEDPEVAERLDDSVPLDPTEDERSDEQAAEDHADDPRQADPLDEERPEQDHGHCDEERPFCGHRWELDREERNGHSGGFYRARRPNASAARRHCRAIAIRSRSSGVIRWSSVLRRLVDVELHPAHACR